MPKYPIKIVIIGAGGAGISAARSLSARRRKSIILEQNKAYSGSSGRNPGRFALGFHYTDIKTAILCLHETIKVQRKYPHYLVGRHLPLNHPIRRGRYYITKDSDPSKEVILNTYRELQKEYARLVTEDPANEVFGPVENFFRILEPHEYENDIDASIVDVGIETAEHLFDFKAFAKDIDKEIQQDPNIELCEGYKVIKIERGHPEVSRFLLTVERQVIDPETTKLSVRQDRIPADYIVNSAWENADVLNDQVGIRMPYGQRTNRLKSMLYLKLPPSMQESSSAFFCMGQHCMFSNLGNGYGMITVANDTNMATFPGLAVSQDARRLLDGKATELEKHTLGTRMLKGAAKYLPKLLDEGTEIVDVLFGIVQTQGLLTLKDLKDPQSSFHRRDYFGVSAEETLGLISNRLVKLFHFLTNGQLVADLIDSQVQTSALLDKPLQRLFCDLPWSSSNDIQKALLYHIERYLSATLLPSDEDYLNDAIQARRLLCQEIEILNLFTQNEQMKQQLITNVPNYSPVTATDEVEDNQTDISDKETATLSLMSTVGDELSFDIEDTGRRLDFIKALTEPDSGLKAKIPCLAANNGFSRIISETTLSAPVTESAQVVSAPVASQTQNNQTTVPLPNAKSLSNEHSSFFSHSRRKATHNAVGPKLRRSDADKLSSGCLPKCTIM
jgi:hypothetical protein